MHPPERLYTLEEEIVAMGDEETKVRSTNANAGKWLIIPLMRTESECALKTTQQTAIQNDTTNEYATTAVVQATSRRTASTSNVPRINATK
jgi:hypothetical protein